MKFMQKADIADENKQEEEKKLKIKDLSEWVLPNSSQIIKRALQKSKVVQSIGYGSINQLDLVVATEDGDEYDDDDASSRRAVPVGRKIWGEPVRVKDDDTNEQLPAPENKNSEPENNGGSLDSLWKSTRKGKSITKKLKPPMKRPAEDAPGYTPDIPNRKKRSTGSST